MNIELKPLALMDARVRQNGEESDTIMVWELLYLGEFVTKLTTSMVIAALEISKENNKYNLTHRLVRSGGIGDWVSVLEEAMLGPASQDLPASMSNFRQELTEKHGPATWQYKAVKELESVLGGFYGGESNLGNKVALLDWFRLFAALRNKTRGHGATTPAKCNEWVGTFKKSVEKICQKNPITQHSWAYLHRNLSGRYRVIYLGGDGAEFNVLKSAKATSLANLENGIYVWIDGYRHLDLCQSDANANDFFFPNGAFKAESFELHSLITDNRLEGDTRPYLKPAHQRPPSETEGLGELETLGKVFTNLPNLIGTYISRPSLEKEVGKILLNDRHPIVTLVGRGGIGKTSLALKLLRDVADMDRFEVIIWFSARDIDLTSGGPKTVKPKVLTDKEIAKEYAKLIGASPKQDEKKIGFINVFSNALNGGDLGPTLFVFDNFETVRDPIDLFNWIDNHIRLPNKVLITSRFRDFKADYPIEIGGMEKAEATELAQQTCKQLKITNLLSKKQLTEVINHSGGHPYVLKILLGEIANVGKFQKPAKIMANKSEILEALFERTFAQLPPLAVRVFLTLSSWKSLVPQLAVEAMIHRHGNPDIDPEKAIDLLVRMSMVERVSLDGDADFLEVPLSAAIFGQRKLEVNPQNVIIKTDVRFLQDLGATSASGLNHGVEPRVRQFFRNSAERIAKGDETLEELRGVLEYFARGFPKAWLFLADLEIEQGTLEAKVKAVEYLERFIETAPPIDDELEAWQRIEQFYRNSGNAIAACTSLLNASKIKEQPYNRLSSMANSLNSDTETRQSLDQEQITAVYKPLSILMEARLKEAYGPDYSRLAWLYLHCGEQGRALNVAEMGVKANPNDAHCTRLIAKLLPCR